MTAVNRKGKFLRMVVSWINCDISLLLHFKIIYVFDITQLSKYSIYKHCDTQPGRDEYWITFKQNSEFSVDREIITAYSVVSCCEMTGFGEMYLVFFICFVIVCWFSHYYPFSRSLEIKDTDRSFALNKCFAHLSFVPKFYLKKEKKKALKFVAASYVFRSTFLSYFVFYFYSRYQCLNPSAEHLCRDWQ